MRDFIGKDDVNKVFISIRNCVFGASSSLFYCNIFTGFPKNIGDGGKQKGTQMETSFFVLSGIIQPQIANKSRSFIKTTSWNFSKLGTDFQKTGSSAVDKKTFLWNIDPFGVCLVLRV